MVRATLAALSLLVCVPITRAQATWQQPPKAVLDVLNAPEIPTGWLDPTGHTLVIAEPLRYPPIADLAAPMLKLAGVRIDPQTNGPHAPAYLRSVALEDVATRKQRRIELPPDARPMRFLWSPDGERFALVCRNDDRIELHVGETDSATTLPVNGLALNPMLGDDVQWMPGSKALLVKRIPTNRGAPPERPRRPEGPNVQESIGGKATSTYEARDVLTSAHDEALFAYHGSSQLALVDVASRQVADLGSAGLLTSVRVSPDAQHLLVERIQRPFSRRHAWWRFPHDVELWRADGTLEKVLAKLPLADAVPIQGVPEGPRNHSWRATSPATVVWMEALDGGDWSRKVPHRDRVLALAAPFDSEAREIHRAVHRAQGLSWGEDDGLLLVSEYERERRWQHGWAVWPDDAKHAPVKIMDLSANDRYADPGNPVMTTLASGHAAVVMNGDAFFRSGTGSSPQGDRPFLDRFSLRTMKTERLFRSEPTVFERFVDWIDVRAGRFVTRRESPTDVPNFFVRSPSGRVAGTVPAGEPTSKSTLVALTAFPDPAPVLRGIEKRIVTFNRNDGVPLSFTLYLPPGYQKGTRLPTILYAYPLEYSDPATAGQVAATERTFTRILGPSHLFLLLSGYAVLHDATMPVIGDPDTAYDTFNDQLIADAQAAIDKAVELGVSDRDRFGVTGHSHGGLMTAALLAQSDLFRAGVARSGAYNHTMRPFGFQSEKRTLWDAMDTYVKLSPVMSAPGIDEPLLIIHGELDANPGTVPLQSEKLYEAVRGTGGTVRLLMLPYESHGYQSREAVEEVLAETLTWFDKWVKNAPPREAMPSGQ